MNDKMAVNDEMLNSWKEVAAYLGRGVRTVQRWELDLGLPVRRPRGKPRSAIIALKPELDQWLTSSKVALAKETSIKKPPTMTPRPQGLHDNTELIISKTRQVMERSFALCAQSQQLCEQLNRVLMLTARLAMNMPRKRHPSQQSSFSPQKRTKRICKAESTGEGAGAT